MVKRDPHPDDKRAPMKGGKLLALPVVDTLRGTPLNTLLARALPYEEAFYYFQRMFRPSPPDVPCGCSRESSN